MRRGWNGMGHEWMTGIGQRASHSIFGVVHSFTVAGQCPAPTGETRSASSMPMSGCADRIIACRGVLSYGQASRKPCLPQALAVKFREMLER